MEMDQQERESELGEESPVSHNDEDMSDGEGGRSPPTDHDDLDDCNDMRRHAALLADHGDVLAKLKMQVRDIKVGDDFDTSRPLPFPLSGRPNGLTSTGSHNPHQHPQDGFPQLPVPFPFPHPAAAFLPPLAAPHHQQPPPQPPSSGSSHSSEGSTTSSQHTWSFEEQFKQVRQQNDDWLMNEEVLSTNDLQRLEKTLTLGERKFPAEYLESIHPISSRRHDITGVTILHIVELYEINDDPKRKEFLDDLFSFMQKRGTPINRLPIMAKSVLDLYELYNLVIARGGLVDVINKKLWQEIIKGLHLPSSITSAAFTLRTQYMKYLYPYECEKRRLSTPAELQAAIDGNRREGRRSSYGQYDSMHHPHHQQQQQQRSPHSHPHHLQMSPLSLVAQQQQQLAARMMGGGLGVQALHNGGAHHPSHPQPLGQPMNGGPLPGLAPSEFEARMMEYVKLLNKEIRSNSGTTAATPPRQGGDLSPPPPHPSSPLDQLEMSRMTLWNLYNNNQPPLEPQKEPINLSEPAVNNNTTFPHSGVNNTLSHSGGNNHLSHSGGNNKNNSLSGGGQIKREPESRESPPPPKRVSKEEEEDLVEEEEDEDEEDDEEEEDRRQRRGVKAKALSPTTNIKINTRGDSRSGDNSLVVSMELNGITYQGVLFAQNAPSSGRTALAS